MVKRVIFIVVWTFLFFVCSAVLGGYISARFRITNEGISFLIVPMIMLIMMALGLFLGLFEKLPGTRSPSKTQDS